MDVVAAAAAAAVDADPPPAPTLNEIGGDEARDGSLCY